MQVKVEPKRKNVSISFLNYLSSLAFLIGQPPKPKDDETIVKNVVRNIVSKVARRLAPRNRRRSQTNNKEAGTNNDNQQQDNNDIDQQQSYYPRRGRGRGRGRPYGGYFMEQGKTIS
jgi:hypothetical protein